ncbi:tannase and feruloyl esterase [Glonium stellatum]|uniref:Carboxylic ester hydrolase n=1 Tax=Glonium stellatum TaxID=574774 RepID=A0A8E2ESH5_9PEZI|nr:tannase and feruloyl esterase [Glonium stellatum]
MIHFVKLAIAATAVLWSSSASAKSSRTQGTTSCASVAAPTVPGAQVLSIGGNEAHNVSVAAVPGLLGSVVTGLNVCNVTVVLTHPGANDTVTVTVWLPLQGWNGRFQATGGGGYATGVGVLALAPAAAAGYAAAETDGGHDSNLESPSSWALTSTGAVNWPLLTDFASRSLQDMAVVGKAVTASYYGTGPRYSYWNGCSTGGRQGLMEAQRYPDDFDGILAASPAINWPSFIVAQQWPQVVMNVEQTFPSQCEFQAFVNASIADCDGLDGVLDGVIADPGECKFDPYKLVGSTILCDGSEVTISWKTADIVRKTLDGPTAPNGSKLWYGLNVGASFSGNSNTTIVNGTTVGDPFPISDTWIQYFLEKDPDYNTSSITYSKFAQLFAQSNAEYGSVIGTDNPDLSAFRAAGGKMITWHGLADQLIFPNGTVNYYERVKREMGGATTVDDFYRLFLAPGVAHCVGGNGPAPTSPFDAVVAWVEQGKAPDTLPAKVVDTSGATVTHDICVYPLVSRYDGKGDPKSASSYSCSTSF